MPSPPRRAPMRPALWLLLAAAAWLGGGTGAQGAGLFNIQSITDTRLENGLHVVVSPDDWADVVAINVVVRAGAANEWGGRRGVAHFMEHMIFKGTATRGVGEIEREIESLGGRINAGTLRDFSHFYVVVASPFFDEALDVLADAVLHPAFPAEEVERERPVILAETTRLMDVPEAMLWRSAFAEALPNYPYGAPISGSLDEIRSIQREDLERFHRTWYVGGNMAVIVVGHVDPEMAFKAIRRRFGEAPAGDAPALRMPSPPRLSELRTAVEERATDRAYVLMAFQAPGLVTEPGDVLAMDLAMAVLGEGYTSRLRRNLQEALPYVQRVSADFLTQREPGLAGVWAICDPQRIAETRAALQATVEGLRARPVSEAELAKAKRVVARNFAFSNETYAEQAETLGFYEALIGYRFACSYLRSVERLTARDVSRVAQKYLDPRRCVWVTIRPPQGEGPQ